MNDFTVKLIGTSNNIRKQKLFSFSEPRLDTLTDGTAVLSIDEEFRIPFFDYEENVIYDEVVIENNDGKTTSRFKVESRNFREPSLFELVLNIGECTETYGSIKTLGGEEASNDFLEKIQEEFESLKERPLCSSFFNINGTKVSFPMYSGLLKQDTAQFFSVDLKEKIDICHRSISLLHDRSFENIRLKNIKAAFSIEGSNTCALVVRPQDFYLVTDESHLRKTYGFFRHQSGVWLIDANKSNEAMKECLIEIKNMEQDIHRMHLETIQGLIDDLKA